MIKLRNEICQSKTRDSRAIESSPLTMTEYKRIVAACPMIPAASVPTMFFRDSSSSSRLSMYRSLYPCRSLCDGGGKDFFFMIPNHTQTADSCARSGVHQISGFFEHFRCSSDAQKNNFFNSFSIDPRSLESSQKSDFFNKFRRKNSELNLNIFNNLVDALPTQIKLICDLAERRTGCAHLQNFRISVLIRRRTRLQWTPLPAGNSLDGSRALFRKLIFSASLTNIPNPSSQCDIRIIDNFSMNCRNITVSLALRELRKSCNIGIESRRIVHDAKISTTSVASRKQLTFNYFLQQNLTPQLRSTTMSSRTGGAHESI